MALELGDENLSPQPQPGPQIDLSFLWPVINWLAGGDSSGLGSMQMSPEEFNTALSLVMGTMGPGQAGRGKIPDWWVGKSSRGVDNPLDALSDNGRWPEFRDYGYLRGDSGGAAEPGVLWQWGTPATQGIPRSMQDMYGDGPTTLHMFDILRNFSRWFRELPPGSMN